MVGCKSMPVNPYRGFAKRPLCGEMPWKAADALPFHQNGRRLIAFQSTVAGRLDDLKRFYITSFMVMKEALEIEEAAQGFAAIGSEARLQVLQALVRAGANGLSVGDIQARTGMAASTLAHHLRFLASAGLIEQEKAGRTVINRAAYDHLSALAAYILKECCADEITSEAAA
jgi:ArsR family transcriptional regulator, arsenate/arsenite/antimonite-responsive transcriptional repressor